MAYRNTEPVVHKFGIKWSLQLGFAILVASSYGFWLSTKVKNDANFATCAFLSRFAAGFGSGLLNAVCLLVRVSGGEFQDTEPDSHFRWHLKAEGFGYLMGPLIVVAFYRASLTDMFFFYLASITAVIWCLFTLCFSEETPACDPNFYSTNEQMPHTVHVTKKTNRQVSFIKSLLYN